VTLGVLGFEAALNLVHQRGLAMQAVVPRTAQGISPFRLAAVDPSAVALDATELAALVEAVRSPTPASWPRS